MACGYESSFRCLKCKKTIKIKINQNGDNENIKVQDLIFKIGEDTENKLKELHGKQCIFIKNEGGQKHE